MSSESYHEPLDVLPPATRDLHRALQSLMEELEAVDWYQQRVDATSDPELAAVLGHNRDEEIEHAMMVLEWIRRSHPVFAKQIGTYLGTRGPITEIESEAESAGEDRGGAAARDTVGSGSLGVGSLRQGVAR